ncbi:NUDIX hydrolase [Brevibacterium luteolum]|uniref:NUDIX hydrolase n=1 Tax=Brevibacterium luteolum TaxID=199591 RepID=UPI003EEA3E99
MAEPMDTRGHAASGPEVVPAAGAVVTDGRGRVLLVLRGSQPHRGRWSLPGGKVEPGETWQQAAAREVAEETGLEVAIGRQLLSLDIPAGENRIYRVRDFAATVTGGQLRARDDAADARWVTAEELAALTLAPNLDRLLYDSGVFDTD